MSLVVTRSKSDQSSYQDSRSSTEEGEIADSFKALFGSDNESRLEDYSDTDYCPDTYHCYTLRITENNGNRKNSCRLHKA